MVVNEDPLVEPEPGDRNRRLPRRKGRHDTLPNFIIIGGLKCGTTSIHHYLGLHPEIHMSKPKELNFFAAEQNWDLGLDWYKGRFDSRVKVNGESVHTVAECTGPVGALDKALRLALDGAYPQLRELELRDYKVRILEGGLGANSRTRVLIESGDGNAIWGTVGVSDNIIDASWEALRDAVNYKLMQARD